MNRAEVRVYGGEKCAGRFLYWGYLLRFDELSRIGYGYKLLNKRDETKIMYYLYGLKSALSELLNRVDAEGGKKQYLVKYFCVDDRVFKILHGWSHELKDPMVVKVVNSIKHLVSDIGQLKLVKCRDGSIEAGLKSIAKQQVYHRIEEILDQSHSWEFSNKLRYIAICIPEGDQNIPLELIARYIWRKSSRGGEIGGIVVFRRLYPGVTVLLYDVKGKNYFSFNLKSLDRLCRDRLVRRLKTFHFKSLSLNIVEDILMKASEECFENKNQTLYGGGISNGSGST